MKEIKAIIAGNIKLVTTVNVPDNATESEVNDIISELIYERNKDITEWFWTEETV